MKEDIPFDVSGRGKLSATGVENLDELPLLYPDRLDDKERWDLAVILAPDAIEFKLVLLEERFGAGTRVWSGIFASQSSSVSAGGGETRTSGGTCLYEDVDFLSERLSGPEYVPFVAIFKYY
jgi:hypothetical protein